MKPIKSRLTHSPRQGHGSPRQCPGGHPFLRPDRSLAVTIGSVAVCGAIVACIIAAAPMKSEQNAEPVLTEVTRICAPTLEADTSLLLPADKPDTESEDVNEISEVVYNSVTTYSSPETVAETTAPVTEAVTEPVTEAVTEPVTEAVTEAVTTAPETTAPETTAAPPVTAVAPSVSVAAGSTAAAATTKPAAQKLLVDELGMEYVIDKPDFTVSESELIRAATVIQLEVMGDGSELYMFDDVQEKYWEMLAVAQCIRNRVDSKHFSPDTVDGIILQPGQFSPAEVLDAYTPTEEALTAAREALVNGVKVVPDNYYYFCATSIEARFERDNDYSLTKKADGTYDKMQGHLTTFYAGFSN